MGRSERLMTLRVKLLDSRQATLISKTMSCYAHVGIPSLDPTSISESDNKYSALETFMLMQDEMRMCMQE